MNNKCYWKKVVYFPAVVYSDTFSSCNNIDPATDTTFLNTCCSQLSSISSCHILFLCTFAGGYNNIAAVHILQWLLYTHLVLSSVSLAYFWQENLNKALLPFALTFFFRLAIPLSPSLLVSNSMSVSEDYVGICCLLWILWVCVSLCVCMHVCGSSGWLVCISAFSDPLK